MPLIVLDPSDSEPLSPKSEPLSPKIEPHSPASDPSGSYSSESASESDSSESDGSSEDSFIGMTIRGVQLCFPLTHSTCASVFTLHLYIHCIFIYMVLLKCRSRCYGAFQL